MIRDEWCERLHAYIGGIVRSQNGVALAVGGVADHVHLLVSLNPTHRIDYLVRDVKADSSHWIHQGLQPKFEWQKGYGVFTVSPNGIESVKGYIFNQPEHHRRKTFQDEYVELLKLSGTEYDERFLW